jgi:hypothetical protein
MKSTVSSRASDRGKGSQDACAPTTAGWVTVLLVKVEMLLLLNEYRIQPLEKHVVIEP